MNCDILSLGPTQFSVGIYEIKFKLECIASFGKKELKSWMKDHEIPCVLGPQKKLYMIDHHHFAAACYHAGMKTVPCRVIADESKSSQPKFWKKMRKEKWVYLFDKVGEGPHDPAFLPYDIRFMADDLYRSLAWELREAGLKDNLDRPFIEFYWAEVLRKHMKKDVTHENYKEAKTQALKLAKKLFRS